MKLDIQKLISEMTLDEKVSLLSGANFWNTASIDRLGIPSLLLTDGPHGVRKQGGKADHLGLNQSIPATCFPTAATLANSWDKDMLFHMGELLGEEASKLGVHVLLGPGLNIKRNPLCGRNFEYFSEDPVLSGKLAGQLIAGIQSKNVSACPKHFAVNSQEHLRMSIDEIVDERALRELYLEGFRIALQEGRPQTIMTSYNKLNGIHTNENPHLLQDILAKEWGYDGVIVTDWGGNNDRLEALKAGNHLEMPSSGGITNQEIAQAVRLGKISETLVNERVATLLKLMNQTQCSEKEPLSYRDEDHHNAAIEFAANSMVLLKNKQSVLPLRGNERVAIIGDFAKNPRFQGAGSSLIEPTKVTSFLDAVKSSSLKWVGYAQGFKRFGGRSSRLLNQAVKLAQKSDVVLLFLGLDEGREAEGIDRSDLSLRPNQLKLLQELKKCPSKIVVVLSGGSPVEMPFVNDVDGILHGYLGGQGSGEAVLKVLTGTINPSGKLAETYPVKLEDVLSSKYFPGKEVTSEHRESIYIGYRYFEKAGKNVLFPFGFGLSYTTFEYSEISVSDKVVSFKITNTGSCSGHEIAQLYIAHKDRNVFKPIKELKGFTKVYLSPGETREVSILLDDHAFSYFHTGVNHWVVQKGMYTILIGASSKDLRLSKTIEVGEHSYENPYDNTQIIEYLDVGNEISERSFEHLLGRTLPHPQWDRKKGLAMHNVVAQLQYQNGWGRFLVRLLHFVRRSLIALKKPIAGNNVYFIINMPFRQVPRFTKGKIPEKKVKRWLSRVKKRNQGTPSL